MDGGSPESVTPPPRCGPVKNTSLSHTQPPRGRRVRHLKRSRSAPDCKHGIGGKVKIGLCAMDKKAQSKPMREILARLNAGGEFDIVTFGDQVIVESPVDSWPLCDVMLSWHSEGFPLKKAQAYVELRRPFLINDVHMQDVLLDRRRVYKTLVDNNVPVPRHILVNREAPPPPEDDEVTTSSSAGHSPRAVSPASASTSAFAAPVSPPAAPSRVAPAASPVRAASPRPAVVGDQVGKQLSRTGSRDGLQPPQGGLQLATQSSRTSSTSHMYRRSSTTGPTVVLPDPPGFIEGEDYVELNGVRIEKPFVEKPVSGEDHNIYIYYPHSMGGGVKRLFRKVDNKSADYDPHHPGIVRRDGSYIYEEFLTTGGTDVKVYTVGPRYAHAEARKSPVVDGKVNRTPDGKEVRFPVLLSPQEKEISRMVCFAFGQRVCGFDLLRSETGRSYVCDVNGWSFVKNSKKYYDDAAGILRSIILSQLAPHRLSKAPVGPLIPLAELLEEVSGCSVADGAHYGTGGSFDDDEPVSPGYEQHSMSSMAEGQSYVGEPEAAAMRDSISLQDLTMLDGTTAYDDDGTDDTSSTGTADSHRWLELRCVLAVVRHGDRTPKQKMKVTVTQAPLLELFNKYKDSKGKQAKLKDPGQLQELLDITRQLLADMETRKTAGVDRRASTTGTEEEKQQELHEEQREKLRIVRTVLEQGGTFSGINRKVQLKPTKWSRRSQQSAADPQQQQQQTSGTSTTSNQQQQQQDSKAPVTSFSAGKRSSSTGGGKGTKDSEQDDLVVTELLLILKFGGVLTHAGRAQAEDLGKMFRMVMYPRYGPAGGGLLRLHSTYRHDMKIYSSDEGRVQMSAAAFIKGMLDLEGSSLTPILVSLVTKNASMLDAFGKGASDDILNAKNTLYKHLTWDPDKALSLCSRLALPLNTPANTSPPMSPKRHTTEDVTAADGPVSPFIHTNARKAHTSQTDIAPASASSTSSSSTAATLARLPTTTSCLDLLHQGIAAAAASTGSSSKADSSPSPPQQPKDTSSHGSSSLAATAAVNAAHAALAAAAAAAAATETKSSEINSGTGSSSGSLLRTGSSAAGWAFRAAEARAAALSGIRTMPDRPLALLYQMVGLMKVLVDELREKCLREERQDLTGSSTSSSSYSSLTTAPDDWKLDEARPCSGERLLLMFDRWRKLLKSFYNEKKQQFDISKVPDIYDSAKYDAIHNSHLDLTPLKDLYRISQQLASVVVPHEYGLDGPGKLIIGSKICAELLGKLICDLDSMKEESIITAAIEAETAAARAAAAGERAMTAANSKSGRHRSNSHHAMMDSSHYDLFDTEFGQMSLEDQRMQPAQPIRPQSWSSQGAANRAAASNSGSSIPSTPVAQQQQQQYAAAGADACATAAAVEGRLEQQRAAASGHQWSAGQDMQQQQQDGDEPEQEEKETLHRLCPTYASDINSPLRHVRTRIYFTSESHIHSLINVLRYCHLANPRISSSSGGNAVSPTPSGLFGQWSQPPSTPSFARPHTAAAAAGGGAAVPASKGSAVMLSAATPSGPVAAAATASPTGEATGAATATSTKGPILAVTKSSGGGSSTSVFASASSAAAAAAGGGGGTDAGPAAAAAASTPQPLVNSEGQALLEETDEFDYLTHIVFRMYENKQAPVDSPDRFFVEVLFSNGANYDPTTVTPLHDNHVLPTKPRRPLTNAPGVTLQMLQELLGRYAKGKNTASNYQLQVALRAPNPLSIPSSHTTSKLPTPGVSRQPSGPLPPAAIAALMAAGPGTVTSAPLPADIAVAAAAEIAAEGAAESVARVVAAAEAAIAATAPVQ